MSIDWSTILERTSEYSSTQTVTDPAGKPLLRLFSGLRVSLAELSADLQGSASVALWADTLVVDTDIFPGAGLVVAARCLENKLKGPLRLTRPTADGQTPGVFEFLLGANASGGPLKLASGQGSGKEEIQTVPTGLHPVKPTLYLLNHEGAFSVHPQKNVAGALRDLFDRPWPSTVCAPLLARPLF